MEMHKDKIENQLNKRHRERQNQINAKHEEIKQNSAASESLQHFHDTFKNNVHSIEEKLNNLTESSDKITLTQHILMIVEDIQNLQNYLTSSTFFLSNYTVKVCQQNITDLTSKAEAMKGKLVAKKKFNFRSKVESTSKSKTTVASVGDEQKTCNLVENQDMDHISSTIQNKKDDEVFLGAAETDNKDITISFLENCLVKINGYPSSLQLSKLTNCIVLCGPVIRSVLADSCADCKFIVACQQLRLHSSHNCDLYMHVTCRAIIEDCKYISVAPFNYSYENINDDFAKAGLDTTKNNWGDLADFNWLSNDVVSPNWKRISPELRIENWDTFCKEFRKIHQINH